MSSSNKIRFMFLRDTKGHPIGCLSMVIAGGDIMYGLSVLNPLDTFDRKLARKIAEGRMYCTPTVLLSGNSTVTSMHDVTTAVMINVASLTGTPMRARKAARHWLNTKLRAPKEIK